MSPRYVADNVQRMIRIMFYTRYACEYLPVTFILHAFNHVGNIILYLSIVLINYDFIS